MFKSVVGLIVLLASVPAGAQESIVEIPFDTIPAGAQLVSPNIGLEGDVLASGEIESSVGFRFPDGSFQTTAASAQTSAAVCESLTANAGIYSNKIAEITPPESYIEVCFKGGGVQFDIHTISESSVGGACDPGDTGWIIERLERAAANWTSAKAQCLMAGMRLPEYFEWQYSCDNAALFGLSEMTNNSEWVSNSSRFFHPEVTRSVGAALMGDGSCSHGTWTFIAGPSGQRGASAYRCVR